MVKKPEVQQNVYHTQLSQNDLSSMLLDEYFTKSPDSLANLRYWSHENHGQRSRQYDQSPTKPLHKVTAKQRYIATVFLEKYNFHLTLQIVDNITIHFILQIAGNITIPYTNSLLYKILLQ